MSADYKAGDTVILEHPDGSRLVRKIVEAGGWGASAGEAAIALRGDETTGECTFLAYLVRIGWEVVSHTPAVTLPTEPQTLWVDKDGQPWCVTDQGLLVALLPGRELANARFCAPFTRLAPVSETAREVVEHMERGIRGGQFLTTLVEETLAKYSAVKS